MDLTTCSNLGGLFQVLSRRNIVYESGTMYWLSYIDQNAAYSQGNAHAWSGNTCMDWIASRSLWIWFRAHIEICTTIMQRSHEISSNLITKEEFLDHTQFSLQKFSNTWCKYPKCQFAKKLHMMLINLQLVLAIMFGLQSVLKVWIYTWWYGSGTICTWW